MAGPRAPARHADKTLAEFIEANELVHVRISDQPRHHLWTQFARQSNLGALNVERGLVFDTAMLAVQYALSGEGIVLVDSYLFADTVRTGKLVKPFENTLDDGYGYYLITHPEALSDTAVALFRSNTHAHRLLRVSVLYLPALLALMMIDKMQ